MQTLSLKENNLFLSCNMERDGCDLEKDSCLEDLDISLNDSKKALGSLFRLFPVILNVDVKQDWLTANLAQPFVVRSKDFCSWDSLEFEAESAGGFSAAGVPSTQGKKFRLKQISFGQRGNWNVYWSQAFAKRTHKARAEPLIANMQGKTLVLSDPLYEAVVSSLLSNLYDLGILPCFSKVFGTEFCKVEGQEGKYTANVLMESSGKSFRDHLLTTGGVPGATLGDYLIWYSLLFRDIEAAKWLIGFYHADMHLNNVLLKKVGSPTKDSDNSEMYDAKLWKEASYVALETPDGGPVIIIENNGMIPKVIDYGLTAVRFKSSKMYPELSQKDFAISNELRIYKMANECAESLMNEAGLKNFEVLFFLLNVLFDLEKIGLGFYPGVSQNVELYNMTKRLVHAFGVNENAIRKLFAPQVLRMQKAVSKEQARLVWFNRRNVGTGRIGPVEALSSLFVPQELGGRKYIVVKRDLSQTSREQLAQILSDEKTIFVPLLPSARVLSSNPEQRFHAEISKYARECVAGKKLSFFGQGYAADKNNLESCSVKLVDGLSYDQEFLLPKSTVLAPSISRVAPFQRKEFLTFRSAVCSIFSRPLFPNIQTELSDIFTYEPYQRLLNFYPPSQKLFGRPMRTVRCSFVRVRPEARCSLSTGRALQKRIARRSLQGKNALCVNGGYFVVGQNIANTLTPGLQGKEFSPIGYYYDGTKNSGTVLPVPPPYREWFAAVTIKDGKTSMMHLPEFEKRHALENVPYRVMTLDGQILEGTQTRISRERRTDLDYDACFCSGPILIWDKKTVFTKDVLLNSKMVLPDGRGYKVFDGAKSNSMFLSVPGETQFPYGQRHSGNFQIHNVLVVLEDGTIGFFFVEGRGYDALGADRVQVAKMLEYAFEGRVKYAVSLDGGFSANAVVTKDGDAPRWLLPDPEKRKLGSSLLFE
ncbi:putative serine/threonine protein kinase [Brazilian marseillevirus]|uniref:putative serine/threonine protein kinase n=1 Tax=Brazilian marseillevirus TaxID=1813599 RepID=UPI000785EB42|nr:putative serine/threonine protein kinase [Brazilian marseillevirus]AMQ10807.1 putative serine/threonine protein kinase [Brazilian marseillevirus]